MMNMFILQLALAGQAAAQQVPAAPAQDVAAAKVPPQQIFERAVAASQQGKCDEALRDFDLLETRPGTSRNPLLKAVIDLRKGSCLLGTDRAEEGEAAVRRSLPVLSAKGDEFTLEVRDAHQMLGLLAANRFDYATAEAEYRLALASSTGIIRLRPLMALAQILAFDKDGEALRHATEARTLAMSEPSFRAKEIGAVQTLYARVLLNQGRHKEAYAELKEGLKKQGGLDLRVDLADLATRSDLAIAALLNGDKDQARRYLAYTGAGRMKDAPFLKAASMQPPLCGEETGLKPSDFAIVEFSLGADGHVRGAQPIYTTGGREVATAFAKAVADWSWTPEAAKSVPLLFRSATRVELRCTISGERPALTAPLKQAYAEWIEARGQKASWEELPDAKAAPVQRATMEAARARSDRAAALAAAVALAENSVVAQAERATLLERAIEDAAALDAPASVRAYISVAHVNAKTDSARRYRQGLRGLLAQPQIAGDALGAATVRLLIASPGYRTPAPEDAQQLLDQVVNAPELPAQHPLKVNALLQQANGLAREGKLESARNLFERTGLTEEQCAFLDLKPAMRRSGVSSNDYPTDAFSMGFEGWVRTEFDIAADGSTIAPRVVIAYPPFVFSEAGTRISNGFRYANSFRPSGGVACTARQESVQFVLP